MSPKRWLNALGFVVLLGLAAWPRAGTVMADENNNASKLANELRTAEAAFAQSMADRDLGAFTQFLSQEVVFFTGENELRGRTEVSDAWSRYFEGEDAPFSWKPEAVSVLDSGKMGFTSGPVFDPEGKRIGTFNSVWRRLPSGAWEIVFDRGCPPCECP